MHRFLAGHDKSPKQNYLNDQKHKIFGQLQSKLQGNFGAQDCKAILLL